MNFIKPQQKRAHTFPGRPRLDITAIEAHLSRQKGSEKCLWEYIFIFKLQIQIIIERSSKTIRKKREGQDELFQRTGDTCHTSKGCDFDNLIVTRPPLLVSFPAARTCRLELY